MPRPYTSRRLARIRGQPNEQEHTMTRSYWKPILLIAALAAGSSLTFAETASAAKMSCIQKYRLCNQRCAGRSGQGDWTACINRTCNRQYDNCASSY